MSNKKVTIHRWTEVQYGYAKMRFLIQHGKYGRQRIHLNSEGYMDISACCSTAEYISEVMYPCLTTEEVRMAFGKIELPEYAEMNQYRIIVPSARESIREVTCVVTEWVKRGMERCEVLSAMKGLDEWLWENAIAEPPEYRWRPVEE